MDQQYLSTFDALNIILPSDAVEKGESAGIKMEGYSSLQEMREKTAEFRAGYKNWRMQGTKGARGETKDVFSGKTQVSNIPKELPLIPERKSIRRDSFSNQVPTVSPQLHKPDSLQAEENPSTWLRFYYNPHTTLDTEIVRTHRLSNKFVKGLPPSITTPTYTRDPSLVDNWILHVGVGGFHRSHQAVYMDEYLEKTCGQSESGEGVKRLPWAYCGVGLMPWDLKMREALRQQDYLYAVWTRSASQSNVKIVGSILDFLFVPDDPTGHSMQNWLLDEKVKIVSLTVTEKGYCQGTDGRLNAENPGVKHDIDSFIDASSFQHRELSSQLHLHKRENTKLPSNVAKSSSSKPFSLMTSPPQTAVGFITAGLLLRYLFDISPFTVQSCDNLPENGFVIQNMVFDMIDILEKKQKVSHGFRHWVELNCKFPTSMVDRITPVTLPAHKELLLRDFQLDDEWPVVAEHFTQWIIEDSFVGALRPAWDSVGALLVHDVRHYEELKLRLLNGGHSAMCYLAFLAGYRFVDDAIADVRISHYLRAYMDEVTPSISASVQIELERYKEKVVERFGNKFIKDSLARITEDGSTKFFSTVRLPLEHLMSKNDSYKVEKQHEESASAESPIEKVENEKNHFHIHNCALAIAAFIIFMRGEDLSGASIEDVIKDSKKEALKILSWNVWNDTAHLGHIEVFVKEVLGEVVSLNREFIQHVSLSLFALKVLGPQYVLDFGTALHALCANKLEKAGHESLLQFLAGSHNV